MELRDTFSDKNNIDGLINIFKKLFRILKKEFKKLNKMRKKEFKNFR